MPKPQQKPKPWWKYLGAFSMAFGKHWWTPLATTFGGAACYFSERIVGVIPGWVISAVVASGFVCAAFRAWLDECRAKEAALESAAIEVARSEKKNHEQRRMGVVRLEKVASWRKDLKAEISRYGANSSVTRITHSGGTQIAQPDKKTILDHKQSNELIARIYSDLMEMAGRHVADEFLLDTGKQGFTYVNMPEAEILHTEQVVNLKTREMRLKEIYEKFEGVTPP